MGKIQASLSLLGGALQNLGGGFASVGNVIQSFAAGGVAGAAITAFGEIAKGLQTSVQEAAASEQAFKDLQVAVEKSGTAWNTVEGATKEYLLQLQKVTVYSDEQVAGALQRLLTFGMSYDEAMKALGGTLDLAAAKHMDLETAANLVGKAFTGNTAILTRYGIDVTTAKEATAAMKDVVEQVAKALDSAGTDSLKPFTDTLAEAGVNLADSEGKMRSVKDIAAELIGAFQTGNVDVEKFSEIMTALGVNIDATKLKAADFPGIMAALNEQFGGTAQEQANTYVGIQERFKNATSELGEKIGTILLPGLAGITEAMIPIVDWFGKGVDAIQAWMTEVGKMPEVKAATDAVGEAWKGLMGWFDSAAKSAQEVLGPALQDLWGALKDLYDALKPIFAAFKELWDAITGSQGDFDAFKIILEAIKLDIQASVEAIRLIIAVVKVFAQGFKEAADFIAPILSQIVSAITGFLSALQTAFQNFYNWLVGASLWQDLWEAVIAVLENAVSRLLSILTEKLVASIMGILTELGGTVRDLWTAAWTGLAELFTALTSAIQQTVSGIFDALSTYLADTFAKWPAWANEALLAVENAIVTSAKNLSAWLQSFMGMVYDAWTRFGDAMSKYMTAVVAAIVEIVKGAAVNVQGILNSMIGAAQSAASTIASILSQIASSIQGTVNQAASAAGTAGNAILGAFTGAWNAVSSAATNFYNWLTGHSLWPDLMDSLVNQTQAGMDEVKACFAKGLGGVVLNAPTISGLTAALNVATPQVAATAATTATTASDQASGMTLTIPVSVILDGEVITRQVEKRIVDRVSFRNKKVA